MMGCWFLIGSPYILGCIRQYLGIFVMWTIEELEKRVSNLQAQVEQSATNHNILIGAKMSMEGLLLEAKKAAEKAAEAIEKVETALDEAGQV